MDMGREITCPCSFFGKALLQRAERQRFLQRFQGDARKDTGWKTVTFPGWQRPGVQDHQRGMVGSS